MTTCQICGRAIKAANGLIAHHGYKRPGSGWQTSSCFGARWQPYEAARDAIPEAIKSLEAFAARLAARNAEMLAEPPATLTAQPRYRGDRSRTFTKPEGFVAVARASYRTPYESEFWHQVHANRREIESAQAQRSFMQDRFDNWPGVAANAA